jgi:tetratricopeptide (TPR) repeat protein
VAALAVAVFLAAPSGVTAQSPQDSDRFIVAIFPFAGLDEDRAEELQEEISKEINDLGPYDLVEQDDVNDALKDAGFEIGNPVPDTRILEIGHELGARIVGTGTVDNRGGVWYANATFVEIATRNTQVMPEVSHNDVEDLAHRVVEVFNARNQADKHVLFGRDYMRGENYDRAITNFQQALEYDPNLAAAYYFMGETYLKLGRDSEALAALEEAVEIDPAYINAYNSIGQTYLEKGDTLQARGFFEELVRQKPNDCDIQIAFGYVMSNQLAETDQGLAAFERAKSICPDNPAAYQYLAYALPNDRRVEKIENFKVYLELSGGAATDPEVLEYLFGLYFAEEQYEEAKATVDQALEADRQNADLQLYAGIVRSKLAEHEEALTYFSQAIELNETLERAYLYRALSHKELGHTTAFAEDLERAGRGRSSEILAGIFLRDAHTNLQRGRTGPALEALNRADQLGGDRCAIAYYRGDAYYRMGKSLQKEDGTISQNERAKEMFERAIRNLQGARCGRYASYADGLIGNANQYIERGDLIIRKLNRGG